MLDVTNKDDRSQCENLFKVNKKDNRTRMVPHFILQHSHMHLFAGNGDFTRISIQKLDVKMAPNSKT